MVSKKILVTGGAGFIGSHLVDRLITDGYNVVVLDNLEGQVHNGTLPVYFNKRATFIRGDVRDYKTFLRALTNVQMVFHLASRVGVAQSNYEIKDYVEANVGGMANLVDIAVNHKNAIQKIIMTASMTSYGEGNYACKTCGVVRPDLRQKEQLNKGDWELKCPNCQKNVTPIAIQENDKINNNSVYALTKNTQEELLKLVGTIYKIPFVSLRCFNVYGPRQSLSNPYTGVTAIFISRLKNNAIPVIYEDGKQTRDFISVYDVVDALVKSMETTRANNEIINIGSGKPTPIKDIAENLAKLMGKKPKIDITHEYRVNDIRHCFADIKKASQLLQWQPKVSLNDGLKELISWSEGTQADDLFDESEKQLRDKSLL